MFVVPFFIFHLDIAKKDNLIRSSSMNHQRHCSWNVFCGRNIESHSVYLLSISSSWSSNVEVNLGKKRVRLLLCLRKPLCREVKCPLMALEYVYLRFGSRSSLYPHINFLLELFICLLFRLKFALYKLAKKKKSY